MTADKAVGEVTHSKTEKIAGDCLHNVLNEFRAVAFDTFPFLSGSDTFIGYGFTAESIFSDTRLDVVKSSTGRKLDEEHPTSTEKFDSVYLCRNLHFDSSLHGIIYIPPEGSNIWIRGTPRFTSEVCQDSGLDCRVIGYHEFVSWFCNKGGTNQLA